MTDNYTNYNKQQAMPGNGVCTIQPLSKEEKADLKMRILLALNGDIQ